MEGNSWLNEPTPLPGQTSDEFKCAYKGGLTKLIHEHFPKLTGKKVHKGFPVKFMVKMLKAPRGKQPSRWSEYRRARVEFERPYREVNSIARFHQWLNEQYEGLETLCDCVDPIDRERHTPETRTLLKQAVKFSDAFGIDRIGLNLYPASSYVPGEDAMQILHKVREAVKRTSKTPLATMKLEIKPLRGNALKAERYVYKNPGANAKQIGLALGIQAGTVRKTIAPRLREHGFRSELGSEGGYYPPA